MKAANRVLFNTGITYARAIVTSLIALYSTRLILSALGAEDYGLYNVIGGMIAMLAFLNAAMTTSTQRFLSFNMGRENIEKIRKVFANSLLVHFFLGILIVAFIELVGFYLIRNELQISQDKISIAIYILHFVVASTFVTIISVPYDAVIIANENMGFLALVNIIDSLFKVAIALSLSLISDDRLFYFGLLTMVSAIIIRIIKGVYTKRKYDEANVNLFNYYDLNQIKDLTSFAGWSLFGAMCSVARNQGVAVLLNLFYSTIINAAYGIANQINSQLMFFSQTLMSAMRPQIIKSEGANNREKMIRLAITANQFSFFLFTLFALPVFSEMPLILDLWLDEVPDYTVEFCRSIILLTMMNQINMGLMTAVQAIGKIKVYQLVAGGIQLFTLPIGFIFLKEGFPPYSVILISFVLESVSTVFRIFYFQHLTSYPVIKYFKEVILSSFISMIPPVALVYFLSKHLNNDFLGFIIIGLVSSITYCLSIYYFSLSVGDKNMLKQLSVNVKNKISSRF
ncbi:O-antigen/teichoic acid export membrane protein [Algoriphagus sp. 4150]|uniref:hypothetical protein n=1 Tax=Algoriphagus sp. 4150 TaxID=2817756 RepID=UPI0028556F09|nr:hypothetical protein [Algoriphagus sp. 4150]MDR7127769.1 O-antigen/teichoic acid export membrane protein [Algoriphagus sp. 4150]